MYSPTIYFQKSLKFINLSSLLKDSWRMGRRKKETEMFSRLKERQKLQLQG
jgi:hypothetical protein